MRLFQGLRQSRRDDAELGDGVWRRAHDRFRRGLDRFHQILEGIQDNDLYNRMLPVGDELADLLPRIRTVCMTAQRTVPSNGMEIPGALLACHRCLTRAGTSLATAAEALALARLAPSSGLEAAVVNVRRRADAVLECVGEAEAEVQRLTERKRP